jgi:hypothetical protein
MRTHPADQRNQYVFDAWADVLVTIAFATGELVTSGVDALVHHENGIERVTLVALEIGFAVMVINHLVMLIWYRTFVGSLVRQWLASRKEKGGGGPGAGAAPPGGGDSETPLPRPEPGHALDRALVSGGLGLGAALFAALVLGLSGGDTSNGFLRTLALLGGIVFFNRKVAEYTGLGAIGASWVAKHRKNSPNQHE